MSEKQKIEYTCERCNLVFNVEIKIIKGDPIDPRFAEPWELEYCPFCSFRIVD